MRYAMINRERCQQIGINPLYRKQVGKDVVITEKELAFSKATGNTVEEKATSESIMLMQLYEVKNYISNYDKNNEYK